MSPRAYALREIVRLAQEYETEALLQQTRDRAYLQKLYGCFNRLKELLSIWPKDRRQLWLEQSAHAIYFVYDIFLGRYACGIAAVKRFYASAFYEFFRAFELPISANVYFRGIVTLLLKRFVHGITRFQTVGGADADAAADPIIMKSARICYIERLIFNEIYAKVFMKSPIQDKAHREELMRMKRVYDSYYPNEAIQAFVTFDEAEGIVPKQLLLIYHNTLTNEIIDETYVKTTQTTVNATRSVRKGAVNQMFRKRQTFDREVPWIRVQPGGGGGRRRQRVVSKAQI